MGNDTEKSFLDAYAVLQLGFLYTYLTALFIFNF